MCGRMTLTTKGYDTLAGLLEAEFDPADAAEWKPRYNVAPTDKHPIVVAEDGRRRLVRAAWGFDLGKPQINARAETLKKRGIFKVAFERRRCLVPADGFYEWTGPKKDRRPIWFHAEDRGLLLMAGLYQPDHHFLVITRAPSEVVAPVHDRMPVVLSKDDARRWLEKADETLLAATPVPLVGTPVSKRANSVANDDPSCLEPPEQARLF